MLTAPETPPTAWLIAGAALLTLGLVVWLVRCVVRLRARNGSATPLPPASEAPRDAKRHFDFLMQMVNHGTVVASPQGEIIEWSAGAEDLFDFATAEILGQPLSSLIAEGDRAAFELEMNGASRRIGGSTCLAVEGLKKDGRKVALEVSLASWSTGAGRELGAVMRDNSKQLLAQERLRETEKNWRDIAENSSDVLLLLDRVGTIAFANRGFRKHRPEDLTGGNVASLLPEQIELLKRGLDCVFQQGIPFAFESSSARDGPASYLWCRLAPQTEDAEVVRAVLTITDLAERRKGELALRRLAAIVKNTRDAALCTDADGQITTWNQGAERLFGWTEQEVIGRFASILCPVHLVSEQLSTIERLKRGEEVRSYDTVRVSKEGRAIPVSVSLSALRSESGEFEGASALMRDMSHQRELQVTLERAKQEAEAASRFKSEFLANMSHEVRTPLNGVVGMTDLLTGTKLDQEQQGYVSTLAEASRALRVIVDDILDFSKLEAGHLAIDSIEFDVATLAQGAVDMFRHAARQAGTELTLDVAAPPAPRVIGDPDRIRQVLANLIGNGVKFTKRGRVRTRLTFSETDAGAIGIRFEVADTGLGISPEAQARLFQPFVQGDGSITRQFGGTGLGLAICRQLLNLMGGTIGMSSRVGVGSTFWCELVLPRASANISDHSIAKRPMLRATGECWRVLVAEDDAINQRVISAMLGGLGLHVDLARNGREAIELWKSKPYAVIFMDCQMPEMSGFDATRAIRQSENGSRTPIIALTAQAYAQDRERCAAAGMDDHLAKPLTRSALESTLSKWLKLAPRDTASVDVRSSAPESGVVDVHALQRIELELGEGGSQVFGELVETFIAAFPASARQMRQALADGAFEQVAFEAHRLRSATSSLAASELSALLRRLERLANASEASDATALMSEVETEFERVARALRAHTTRHKGSVSRSSSSARPGQERDNA